MLHFVEPDFTFTWRQRLCVSFALFIGVIIRLEEAYDLTSLCRCRGCSPSCQRKDCASRAERRNPGRCPRRQPSVRLLRWQRVRQLTET